MTDPLVSVVIPVYNRRALVDDAILSVRDQELPPSFQLEVVVVDDGSDDGSAEVAEAHGAQDSRVRLIRTAHTGFPGAARNRGVEAARGEIIAFLDSDDRWLPGKVAAQLGIHRRGGLSHTRERWIRNGRAVSQATQRHRRSGDIFDDALEKCIIGPSTAMVDAGLYRSLGGFSESIEVAEDYEFWLRALCHTAVAYIDVPLTEKRAGPWAQLSEKYGQIEGFRIAALRGLVDERYFAIHRSVSAQRTAATVLAKKMEIFAKGARKRGRVEEATELEEAANKYKILHIF